MQIGRLLAASLALATLVFGIRCPGQEPAKKVRILGVGNSFTQNATTYLTEIIKADPSLSADVGVAYIGGCSLERHTVVAKANEANPDDPKGKAYNYVLNAKTVKKSVSLKDILRDGPWDHITIQQVSTGSWKEETFYPYARELVDYLKRYAPDATIVVHETWSHRIDCPRTKQWKMSPEEMYEKLHANYAKIAGELSAQVIPVGTAFENAKKLPLWQYEPPADFDPATLVYPNLPDQSKSIHYGYSWQTDPKDKEKKVLRMDGFHAGRPGQFLGGLVWYEFFFHKDARANPFLPAKMTEEEAKSLREVAHQTMEAAR